VTPAEDPEELTAAERGLATHLALLKDGIEAPDSLASRIMRTARWQRSVRSPLLAVAHLASAALETIRLLIGGGTR
jgi:hypothetical protein